MLGLYKHKVKDIYRIVSGDVFIYTKDDYIFIAEIPLYIRTIILGINQRTTIDLFARYLATNPNNILDKNI